jgi:RHS repeat-associated protein
MLNGELDEVLVRTDSSGALSPIGDGLGSVVALSDSAGTVQTQYTYEPFGKTTTAGASSSNPSKYTAREDDDTGLYYYRARYYSPTLQRFISEDPIGFSGGMNFYAYAENDPVNGTDPYGLKTFVCCRPLLRTWTFLFWALPVPFARHCYILVTPGSNAPGPRGTSERRGGANGNLTYGLHDPTNTGRSHRPVPDEASDSVNDSSKDCKDVPGPQKERKLAKESDNPKNCRGCGSNYNGRNGPNSNTYVSDVLSAAGMQIPYLPWVVPGYDGRGWFKEFVGKKLFGWLP